MDIMVVDDQDEIRGFIKEMLEKKGHKVFVARNGKEAIDKSRKFHPDIILMDVMMPNMDGIEACRQIKESTNEIDPYVIFLTARAEEYTEVAAFDVGADDYIVKPIKPRALMSRISALFRRKRSGKNEKSTIKINDLVIDKSSYTVTCKDKNITLPKKEFELLFYLAQNPNKVHTRDELLLNIWGSDVYVLARTVDVHIRKVREKIGEGYISTLKGVGYKFETS